LWAAWRRKAEPATRFLIVWIAAIWIVVELIPTKLPHYIIPIFPALAFLCAQWIVAPGEEDQRFRRLFLWIAGVQFGVALLLLLAAPLVLPWLYGNGLVLWLAAPALLGFILGITALRRFLADRRTASVWYAVVGVLVLYPTITAGMGPNLQGLWVSPRAAEMVARNSLPDDPPVSAAGYTEPSLMFLIGTPTHLLPGGAGAAEAVADAGGLALIEDSERSAFLARLAELEGDAEVLGELDGYNYSRGRKVHITLYRTRAVPRVTAPPQEE
jgi:4-amino-4-deoxy-L-arabinose transferase-like glycosyltransferase